METRNKKTFTETYTGKNGSFIVTITVWQELKSGQSFKNVWLWEQTQTVTCPDGEVIELASNLASWELNKKYNLPMNAPARIPAVQAQNAASRYQSEILHGTVEQQKERARWENAERNADNMYNA